MTDTVTKYKSFAHGLLCNPNDTTTLVDQFALLANEGDKANLHHCLHLARRAAAIEPNRLETVFNLGGALEKTGHYDEALTVFLKCLTLSHADFMPQLLHDIGVAYRGLGENEKAIEWYDKAIELNPQPLWKRDRAISMMAGATMGTHSFVEALKAFESRRELAAEKYKTAGALVAQQRLPTGVVHWQGEDLTGKIVVVYHEEGAGDFIQFCRFIPKLWARKPAKILLTGPNPELLDLVSDNIAISGIVPLAGPFESDYVIGSMSLPWRLGIEYEHVNSLPYMTAQRASIPRRGELNVGLVWRGNPVYKRDHMRSMAFETYTPLFEIPEAAFYSLQVGPASSEIDHTGFTGFVADLQPFMKTWRQTARVIEALDVVVTVDTAVAHLAGALGKPVFILITNGCDWRWHRKSDKTVWYKSARVIRQRKQDEWGPCIEHVKYELLHMIGNKRQAQEDPNIIKRVCSGHHALSPEMAAKELVKARQAGE